MASFLDDSGVVYLWQRIKSVFATKDTTVSTSAQSLSDTQQRQARINIGAGTSEFSGDYADLTSKPVIDTALSQSSTNAVQNKAITNTLASFVSSLSGTFAEELTKKSDVGHTHTKSEITDFPTSLPASDVPSWAKASTKPTYTATEVGAIANTMKGANSGVAELDENGKVPSSQLPSYVDDVLDYSSKTAFPSTGESGKIYVDNTTNLTYRWSGSDYVEISPSLALGTTSSTAFAGDKGNAAYNHSQIVSGNPHKVTKSDVGLGNVDNTADSDKSVKSATSATKDASGNVITSTYATKSALTTVEGKIPTIVTLTQSAYDALVTKDASTIYLITE